MAVDCLAIASLLTPAVSDAEAYVRVDRPSRRSGDDVRSPASGGEDGVVAEPFLARASSFGEDPLQYDRARPSYPEHEVYRGAPGPTGKSGATSTLSLDADAGTDSILARPAR